MRPVQTLYYEHGSLHCPIHGNKYIQLLLNDAPDRKLYWCCAAMMENGMHCTHSAKWNSLSEVTDAEVGQLTEKTLISMLGTNPGIDLT
jgi:hypothetical protein